MGTKTSMRTSKKRRANQQIASIKHSNALGIDAYLAISKDWVNSAGMVERLNELWRSGRVSAVAEQLNTTSLAQRAIHEFSRNERDVRGLTSLSRELQSAAAFNGHFDIATSLQQSFKDASALPKVLQNVAIYKGHLGKLSEFQSDLKKAEALLLKVEFTANIQRGQAALKAFQREFSDFTELERHVEKAKAFQSELDRVATYTSELDTITALVEVKKHQAFMDARNENYHASLRLEGFSPHPDCTATTLADLKAKYVR